MDHSEAWRPAGLKMIRVCGMCHRHMFLPVVGNLAPVVPSWLQPRGDGRVGRRTLAVVEPLFSLRRLMLFSRPCFPEIHCPFRE